MRGDFLMSKKSAFNWMEVSGAFGDLGLFIPLVVAMTITCQLDLGVVLILAGVMNILTGFIFNQPLPVQPMKALAAVVITEGMVKEELFAAGICIAIILLILSFWMEPIKKLIPKSVVRGIQLGVGIKLALTGFGWLRSLTLVGLDSMLVGIVVFIVLSFFAIRKKPVLLFIFIFGFAVEFVLNRAAFSSVPFSWPYIFWQWPTVAAFKSGFLNGTLVQLPLTLLNSVIAVCALSADYFPGSGIKPKKMILSIGLMNLFCVPLGGIPMCHGAGGLAAQYRFGARSGVSVIFLGVLKIAAGLTFGSALVALLVSYPVSILAPMLVLAGIELARTAADIFNQRSSAVVACVSAAVIVGVNTLTGFLAGCTVALIFYILKRRIQT